jgi:hypothetical protein
MDSLGGDSEREAFQERALKNANSFSIEQYRRALKSEGCADIYLDLMLREQMMREVGEPSPEV